LKSQARELKFAKEVTGLRELPVKEYRVKLVDHVMIMREPLEEIARSFAGTVFSWVEVRVKGSPVYT
jgi:hypothetical protein